MMKVHLASHCERSNLSINVLSSNSHCEERSDEAIFHNTIWKFFYKYKNRLLRPD